MSELLESQKRFFGFAFAEQFLSREGLCFTSLGGSVLLQNLGDGSFLVLALLFLGFDRDFFGELGLGDGGFVEAVFPFEVVEGDGFGVIFVEFGRGLLDEFLFEGGWGLEGVGGEVGGVLAVVVGELDGETGVLEEAGHVLEAIKIM